MAHSASDRGPAPRVFFPTRIYPSTAIPVIPSKFSSSLRAHTTTRPGSTMICGVFLVVIFILPRLGLGDTGGHLDFDYLLCRIVYHHNHMMCRGCLAGSTRVPVRSKSVRGDDPDQKDLNRFGRRLRVKRGHGRSPRKEEFRVSARTKAEPRAKRAERNLGSNKHEKSGSSCKL